MLGSSRPDAPATRGGGGGIYVVVIDPDAHCARARDAGAEILREPFDTDYGSRDYSAKDPEGNVWHFGTYQPFAFDHESGEDNGLTCFCPPTRAGTDGRRTQIHRRSSTNHDTSSWPGGG
jgi:hypothetical protein